MFAIGFIVGFIFAGAAALLAGHVICQEKAFDAYTEGYNDALMREESYEVP